MAAIYFAFNGKLESANALFPEVLFDPQLARGSSWINGQWWFHVSATDCENNGGYGVYNNCQLVQPDWQGVNNFMPGAPYTDTVEMRIPFSKIGFNPTTHHEMGIAFLVTNTANIFKLWPATADRNVPSTWSTAGISTFPVDIPEKQLHNVHIYPNPVSEMLVLEGIQQGAIIKCINISGQIALQVLYDGTPIEVSNLLPGLYHLLIIQGDNIIHQQNIQKL